MRIDFRLCVVTDRRAAETAGRPLTALLDTALARAAARGARVAVQLREKDLDGAALLALARELREVTRAHGARLLVNDRLDIALAAEADGVHLPADGIPPDAARRLLAVMGLIGVSTHAAHELPAARGQGADYAFLGPIYDTESKRAYGAPLGVGPLAHAAQTGLPVLAVGGVTAERVAEVRRAGAYGVAVIGAVMRAPDPAAAMDAILEALAAAEAEAPPRPVFGNGGPHTSRDGGSRPNGSRR
jgi:thiamine-phosphate pyrophosphorylase